MRTQHHLASFRLVAPRIERTRRGYQERRAVVTGTLLLVWLGPAILALAEQQEGTYRGKEEALPREVDPQPIPFSHRRHASLGIECLDCHPAVRDKAWAGLPNAGHCLQCHVVLAEESETTRALLRFQREGGKIPWVRVYQVPHFVFFSHAHHTAAGLDCQTCHGPVQERDRLAQELSTGMVACMNCHAALGVFNHCHFCHSLGQ